LTSILQERDPESTFHFRTTPGQTVHISNCSSYLQVNVCSGASLPTTLRLDTAVTEPVMVGAGANPTFRVKEVVVALKPVALGALMATTQVPRKPALKKKLFPLLFGAGLQPDPPDPSTVMGN